MTHFRGRKYEDTKDLTTVQVAALIRPAIKEVFPELKVSVRSEYYSMGSSIDVRVKSCDFNPINPKWDPNDYMTPMEQNQRYTERGHQLLKDLEQLVNEYNRDDSDNSIDYFDVRFYSSVEYSPDFERECIEKLRSQPENKPSSLESLLKIDLKKLSKEQIEELRLFLNRSGILPFTEVI